MIERFYTTTFTNERMEWEDESSGRVSVGEFCGHIQQARPEYAASVGEQWGKTFIVWCPKDTDVQAGDTLTIADGNDYAGKYSVKNSQLNAVGDNQHLELTVIKDLTH